MIKLALIADDFTGAIDTSVQFAKYGFKTDICIISDDSDSLMFKNDTEILVVDAETRHLDPDNTYGRISRIACNVKDTGTKYLYLKTDSALRGEVGSMIKAVMDVYKSSFLAFIPAFPESGRITKHGVQYINTVPVSESEFGSDPFDPVLTSRVKDLFSCQDLVILEIAVNSRCETKHEFPTVAIFDAESNQDLEKIAFFLRDEKKLNIVAGCAGFARVLPDVLNFSSRVIDMPVPDNPLFIVSGSLNPVTRRQIEYGESKGFERIILEPEQCLDGSYLESSSGQKWLREVQVLVQSGVNIILDTGISCREKYERYLFLRGISKDDARILISDFIGDFLAELVSTGTFDNRLLMIIGGDTFLGFYRKTMCSGITPICEIEAGTILSLCRVGKRNLYVISKSGGLGNEDIFLKINTERNREETYEESYT